MRILLIAFFIKLCYVHLYWCKNVCYDVPSTVFLLRSMSKTHDEINELFMKAISSTRIENVIEVYDVYGEPLKSVLNKFSNANDYVVLHLHVTDFYQYNYKDILERNFTFVGNIGRNKTLKVCRSEHKTDNNNVPERCKESNEKLSSVKLASNNIETFPELHDFILNFDGNSYNFEPRLCKPILIAVCGNIDDIGIDLEIYADEMLKITHKKECEDLISEHEIAAVLAPKPFKLTENLYTTTIFYDHLYESSETSDMFKNSFSLVKSQSREKIKFAFLKFIQMMDWNRIGIISDDSPISEEFERELTSLFEKNSVIYASKSCLVSNCNFTEVLRPFNMAEATVMIVNVGEEYAEQFANQAAKLNIYQNGIVWLVRAWSSRVARKASTEMGDVFSITLGLTECFFFNPHFDYNTCDLMEAIRAIKRVLNIHQINHDHLLNTTKQRKFTEMIGNILHSIPTIQAYVIWYKNDVFKQIVAEISISHSNVATSTSKFMYPYHFSSGVSDYCSFKSNVYFKPCNDTNIILIILIIAVFTLTLLGIVYFFEMSDRTYSRMSC